MGQGLLDLSCCVSILIATPFESHLLQPHHQQPALVISFVIYYCTMQMLLMRINVFCCYLTTGSKGQHFFVVTTYLNNEATAQNLIIIERVSLTRCLLWNNTAESSTLIPEEAVCIHPSVRLLQLLRPAVPSVALLMIHLSCCIRIQEVLRRWRVHEIETFEH